MPKDLLRTRWQAFLPDQIPDDDASFADALEWATEKVRGGIALLEYSKAGGGYRPHPGVADLCAAASPNGPDNAAWTAAWDSAPPAQAWEVGMTAAAAGRWDHAIAALSIAADAPEDRLPALSAARAARDVGVLHSFTGDYAAAIAFYDRAIRRAAAHPGDVELRRISAEAANSKGGAFWKAGDVDQAVKQWDATVAEYFLPDGSRGDPSSRAPAAFALYNKVDCALGSPLRGDIPPARAGDAEAAWNTIIDDYFDPTRPRDPEHDAELRYVVAKALTLKAALLAPPAWQKASGPDRETEALDELQRLIATFDNDPDPRVQGEVDSAKVSRAQLRTRFDDHSDQAVQDINDAIRVLNQPLQIPADFGTPEQIEQERERKTALGLEIEAVLLRHLGCSDAEHRQRLDNIIDRLSGATNPISRRVRARVLLQDARECDALRRANMTAQNPLVAQDFADIARRRLTQLQQEHGREKDPGVEDVIEKAGALLKQMPC